MKGTEKQIKWAEQILADARNTIQANIRLAQKNYEKYNHEVFFEDRLTALNLISDQFEAMVENMTASMIIDARDRISPHSITCLLEKTEDKIRAEKRGYTKND